MMNRGFAFKLPIVLILFWLICLAVFPFLGLIVVSFLSRSTTGESQLPLTCVHYTTLLDPIYLSVFGRSFCLAGLSTLICLLIAYPFSLILAHVKERYQQLGLMLVIIPFWTSSLIRSYAIMAILKTHGILNSFLMTLGVIDLPLEALFTQSAVVLGMVYNLLPFMIFPLFVNLDRLDKRILEAAADLGAGKWTVFFRIVLPLSMPGVIGGCMLVFLPAMTLFYIADFLGGAKSLLLGNVIKQTFLQTQNWPLGSAISVVLLCLMGLLFWLYAVYAQEKPDALH